jgi:hypothetical protein
MCSNMIECARQYILRLCNELQEQRNHVFQACGSGDFESAYFAPDLVRLQYDYRSFAGTDGHWNKVGKVFGHKELIDEITDNSGITNILLAVCS